ncbi:LamG-like jellyroll fold domain-containing protein [Tundrisphaera lichenicola]|uniref:LamG domain-containing protein n=1 Tax=Tundrisphaera lichenicola TaxID=2029860 RepID=UPI003EBA8149
MKLRGLSGMIFAALLGLMMSLLPGGEATGREAGQVFRGGAAIVDISPTKLPAIVNGGFLEARAEMVRDPLKVRALVLDDGSSRIAIVVVDSCMLPRDLIDRAKEIAKDRTGIPIDRMLISATHTHTAPAAMGALGSRADLDYIATLPEQIADSVAQAVARLAPARIGWAVVDDPDHTHCRRWIRRPDRLLADPFGDLTVRANMHPGYENPDVIGPSGPVDPTLSILALRTPEGKPVAVLANYSMHYFGTSPVSADYYGAFADRLARLIAPGPEGGDCVVMMSQGTSGDQHWMDYGKPKDPITIEAYAEAVADRAAEALRKVEYQPWASLAMAEARITLKRRVPDEKRLAWARSMVARMGDQIPRNVPEVYAQEAIALHDEPERELKLQAIRIGELGIATIPDEVYALTGLKIKARSPLSPTVVFSLANGSEGYIPPPAQHALGGYTTWPARTAALEVQAEPKIVEAVLGLLEKVSGRLRGAPTEPGGDYVDSVLASKPTAFWRLGEMEGPSAADATGQGHRASFEGPLAFYLEGPPGSGFTGPKGINRAIHLAGGHLDITMQEQGRASSLEFWFWNGMPNDAREVTGVLVSRPDDTDPGSAVERLVIGGTGASAGRLLYLRGKESGPILSGKTELTPKGWHHIVLSRDGENLSIYLDGQPEATTGSAPRPGGSRLRLKIGGGSGTEPGLEGKIDEVAVYDRSLSPEEIADHHRKASGTSGVTRP